MEDNSPQAGMGVTSGWFKGTCNLGLSHPQFTIQFMLIWKSNTAANLKNMELRWSSKLWRATLNIDEASLTSYLMLWGQIPNSPRPILTQAPGVGIPKLNGNQKLNILIFLLFEYSVKFIGMTLTLSNNQSDINSKNSTLKSWHRNT